MMDPDPLLKPVTPPILEAVHVKVVPATFAVSTILVEVLLQIDFNNGEVVTAVVG